MTALGRAIAIFLLSASTAVGAPQAFALHKTPQPAGNIRFMAADGTKRTLASFRGKVLLVNVWATWCAPCRQEMPTLDALQSELGDNRFEVLALSVDRAGLWAVQRFYDETGVRHLAEYVDTTMLSFSNLHLTGLPTTLLIDAKGRELGRLVGPARWNDPAMVSFLKRYTH